MWERLIFAAVLIFAFHLPMAPIFTTAQSPMPNVTTDMNSTSENSNMTTDTNATTQMSPNATTAGPAVSSNETSGMMMNMTAAPSMTMNMTAAPSMMMNMTAAPSMMMNMTAAPSMMMNMTGPPSMMMNMTAAPSTPAAPAPTTPLSTTTTTTAAPTRPPSRPGAVVGLRVVLAIVFQAALSDTASPEFRQEASRVENALNPIYRGRFGALFLRTIVRAFRLASRRTDNVQTDVDLVFDETSSEPIPDPSAIGDTLRNAGNSSGLSVVPGSIAVTSAPQSRAIPQFRTNEVFTADLSNSSSNAFANRSRRIKSELEPFFFEAFQPEFIALTPTSFSNGSIINQVNMVIIANGTFPSDSVLIQTLTRAAQSGNLTFTILSINGTAVPQVQATTAAAATTTPATTGTTTTTTTAPPTRPPSRPGAIVVLRVVLVIVFQPALTNTASPEFQQAASRVENALNSIYRERFGALFLRTTVRAFVLTSTRTDNVQTDVDLVFDETSSEPIPDPTAIGDTLRNAGNSTGLSVVPGSIEVRSSPQSRAIPQFRTNEVFTADLSNSSSNAFANRSRRIKSELEPFFFEAFQPEFIALTPTSFSNGSIINQVNMVIIANGTFPSDSVLIETLTRAAQSGNLTFTILSINGTAVPQVQATTAAAATTTTTTTTPATTAVSAGEVSSKVNVMTACGLTLLSLLVVRSW